MDNAKLAEVLKVLRTILSDEFGKLKQSIEASNKTSQEAILSLRKDDRTDEVVEAINEKEEDRSDMLEALESIDESINNIEQSVNVEAPNINLDTESIEKGLSQVSLDIKAIKFPDVPETEKTRDLLIEIANRIEKTDLSKLEELVEGIKVDFPSVMDVNLDPNLIEDGYVKVRQDQKQVDQMSVLIDSGAANGANLSNKLEDIKTEIGKIIGFEIGDYNYIALTYVAAGNGAGEIETVTYKEGGAGGTTKAILTLAYDASNNLISVTRT